LTLGTHLAFASVLYLGGATLFGYPPDAIGWMLAAVASLLPDLDLPPSKIGRLFWFVSVPLERRFGHRTLTHSLVALGAVMVLAGPLLVLQPRYGWAVGVSPAHHNLYPLQARLIQGEPLRIGAVVGAGDRFSARSRRADWILTAHGQYLMARHLPAGPARVSPYRALP